MNTLRTTVLLTALLGAGSLFAQPAAPAGAAPAGRAGGGGGRGGAAVPVDSPVVSFGTTPKTALLLGEKNAGRLVIIDPETLEIVARIPAGGNLHEIATDGRFAYIGSNLPGITVVDVAAQKRVESIDTSLFGSFHGLTVANGKLYVGHENNRTITRWDPATRKFDWVYGMAGGSHLLRVTEDERMIIAPSSNGRVVSVLEATGASPSASVPGISPTQQVAVNVMLRSVGAQDAEVNTARTEVVRASLTDRAAIQARVDALMRVEAARATARGAALAQLQAGRNRLNADQVRAVAALAPAAPGGRGGAGNYNISTYPGDTRMEGFDVSPDGRVLWTLNMNAKSFTAIDLVERKVIETVSFEGGLNNRIKFTPDGKHVYMNELQGTYLRVWDAATRKEINRIEVGAGGEGIFMDPDRPRAYYAVSNGNKLAVIDTNTMAVIKEIPELLNPDGMDWYVAR